MHKTSGKWIWIPSWDKGDEREAAVVLFRREMNLETVPESFNIKISADTRYKLYINGCLCEFGPSKGDREIWFYDEVDTAPFLKTGVNVWAVIVLRYPQDSRKGNMSLFRTEIPGLYLESTDCRKDGEPVWKADRNWKTRRLDGYHIVSENPFFAPLQIYENNVGSVDAFGWMNSGFDTSGWENAMEYNAYEVSGNASPGNLKKRTIPFMNKIPGRFKRISRDRESSLGKEIWTEFLEGKRCVTILPHSHEIVDIDAGELMTGFLRLEIEGGEGAQIHIHQAECYVKSIPTIKSYDDLPEKGDRTDASRGLMAGNKDVYTVCGLGTKDCPEVFSPFWFRTFRFIRLVIETGEKQVTLNDFSYLETGYPLEVKTHVETSDCTMKDIWDISERTLRRCMHETYEDCPFYEQLQYAMDSRSQILYTYAISADDRLARKCIDDFRRSQRYDGLLTASYPNTGGGVIPGFSIFYIGMLYDHMMYFGDSELIQRNILAVDGILDYFLRHRNEEGLVRKIGDLNRPDRYWSFVDWTPEWKDTNGVPSAALNGPITMESLLCIMGLQYAVKLNQYIGRTQIAEVYEKQADKMKSAVNRHCRGESGMLKDGPGCEKYSQHCQVFAVLTDTVSKEEGRRYLMETLENKEQYAQCSVAMMYYLFRALEKCGLYEMTDELWNTWKRMLQNHMTTCAEDSLNSRSDCHAWGSLILYELPSVILGVRPSEPGFEKISIFPSAGDMKYAKGTVITPKGMINISWTKKNGKIEGTAELPRDLSADSALGITIKHR